MKSSPSPRLSTETSQIHVQQMSKTVSLGPENFGAIRVTVRCSPRCSGKEFDLSALSPPDVGTSGYSLCHMSWLVTPRGNSTSSGDGVLDCCGINILWLRQSSLPLVFATLESPVYMSPLPTLGLLPKRCVLVAE